MQAAAKTSRPSKQRSRLFQASDHIRYKHFAAPLSPELRKIYTTRSLPLRAGDTVRVMRGDRKGFEGKVSRIDRKKYRLYVEGLTREKVDGTTVFIPVHPSKVMITKLNLDDKWRKKILERRKKAKEAGEVAEKAVEKTEEGLVKEEKPVEEKAAEELPPTVKEAKPKRRKTAARKRTAEKPEAKETRAKTRTRKRKSKEESESG